MDEAVTGLRCALCGTVHESGSTEYVCPNCGEDGILDVLYDYDLVRRTMTRESLAGNPDRSIWRYAPLLPVADRGARPNLQIGWTPLYRVDRLGKEVGLSRLFIKDDGRNPTASLKDRASALALSRADTLGFDVVATASTGNAASSLAGLAASMGRQCVIFVPEAAPPAKVAQLLVYGATVFAVRGTYDDAFDLCLKVCDDQGWYCRNTGYNPFMAEGKKTVALEICEQLEFQVPDWIVVSAGDGCITDGVGKGLWDLLQVGLIDRMPRILSVQSSGSAALYQAWSAGGEAIAPVQADTVADSISVNKPRAGIKALRAVRRTEGRFVAVPDDEILASGRLLGAKAGVFAEPAGAAPLAGVVQMLSEGVIGRDDSVVVVVSGNGLKDAAGASRGAGRPISVAADGSDLAAGMAQAGL